jgi:DNA-binding protein HU-beta
MPPMNKARLIDKVSHDLCITKKEAQTAIEVIFNSIKDFILDDGSFSFPNFGKFFVKIKKAKEMRNPKTGDKVYVEERRSIRFKPSKNVL